MSDRWPVDVVAEALSRLSYGWAPVTAGYGGAEVCIDALTTPEMRAALVEVVAPLLPRVFTTPGTPWGHDTETAGQVADAVVAWLRGGVE